MTYSMLLGILDETDICAEEMAEIEYEIDLQIRGELAELTALEQENVKRGDIYSEE